MRGPRHALETVSAYSTFFASGLRAIANQTARLAPGTPKRERPKSMIVTRSTSSPLTSLAQSSSSSSGLFYPMDTNRPVGMRQDRAMSMIVFPSTPPAVVARSRPKRRSMSSRLINRLSSFNSTEVDILDLSHTPLESTDEMEWNENDNVNVGYFPKQTRLYDDEADPFCASPNSRSFFVDLDLPPQNVIGPITNENSISSSSSFLSFADSPTQTTPDVTPDYEYPRAERRYSTPVFPLTRPSPPRRKTDSALKPANNHSPIKFQFAVEARRLRKFSLNAAPGKKNKTELCADWRDPADLDWRQFHAELITIDDDEMGA